MTGYSATSDDLVQREGARRWALARRLAVRDIAGRFRGAALGAAWLLLLPLANLLVYTFVFSVVFKNRWGALPDTPTAFGLVLFLGLITHGFLADVINRSPSVIQAYAPFIKRVVFPVEVLPLVPVLSAAFTFCLGFGVYLIAHCFILGVPQWTVVAVPLAMAPLAALACGIAWLLSSGGAYVKDINQVAGVVSMMLLFLCPIFFPIDSIPESYRGVFYLNPLTVVVLNVRALALRGEMVDAGTTLLHALACLGFAGIGFVTFQRLRSGFSDVV